MTRVIGILAVATTLLLAATEGIAQDKTEEPPLKVTEPVVVTATKTPTPVAQTGSSVTVIEGAAIEQRQTTDMLQILRDQPGFSVIQNSGRGSLTDIFSRGGNANMNLVLIDGMKVNLGGGGFDLANITSIGMSRVEIVRGPQSALYGADAMTSVIQFFSPRGEGPFSAWGFMGGGNYGTQEERTGFSWGNQVGGVFFEFGNVETSGFLDENNGYTNRTGALRLDLTPSRDLGFTLTSRYIYSKVGVPTENAGDRFETLDPNQFQRDNRFVGTLSGRYRQTPWLEHRASFGANLTKNEFVDSADNVLTDFPPNSKTEGKERRLLADYNAVLSPPPFWQIVPTIVLGASYENENFIQDSVPLIIVDTVPVNPHVDVSRHTNSGYAQVQLAWRDAVFLTAGARYDSSTAFGDEWTPRVAAAVVAPVTLTRVRGAWGTGIKAPSFFEEFGGFGVPGNPNIKTEKSHSWEIGVDQPLFGGILELGATYFHNDFEDLIAFVSLDEAPVNIQGARTQGVEFVATLRPIKGWTATANYTYLNTDVTDDGGVSDQNTFPQGQPLLRRPTHSGSITVGYTRDRFSAVTSLFVKGASIDRNFNEPGAPRVNLPGYQKLDLSFAYVLFKDVIGLREVVWKTRFQNVLNEKYEEVFGFSAPRLSALTGIEVRY